MLYVVKVKGWPMLDWPDELPRYEGCPILAQSEVEAVRLLDEEIIKVQTAVATLGG
jgi:hypothetical protein